MAKKTFYDVLQVSPSADPEIIKAAYRKFCERYHPDKNPGNPEAKTYLQIITQAYDVLSDPAKRAGYDAALAETDEDQPERSRDEIFTKEAAAKEDNSGGTNAGNPYAAPESQKSTPGPCPWIRFWARFIDNFVWGAIVYFPIGFAVSVGAIPYHSFLWLLNPFISSMLLVFTWALVEPIVIAVFGTTLGKVILRIRLTHRSNENLSKVDPGVLYQRSMAVWLKGMGLGFPFVSAITALVSYRNLKSQGETSWDRDYGFTVTHGKVGYIRGSLATIIILFAMILNAVGNEYQKHQILAAAQQSQQATTDPNDPLGLYQGAASPQSQQSTSQSNPLDDPNFGADLIPKSGGSPPQSQPSTSSGLFDDVLGKDGTSPQSQQAATYLSTDPNFGLGGASPQSQQPVSVKWVAVNYNDVSVTYADPATIHKNGNIAEIWALLDFKTVQVIEGAWYISTKAKYKYACMEKQAQMAYFSWHSENMGGGEIVYSDATPGNWKPIPPGSGSEALWKIACGKR